MRGRVLLFVTLGGCPPGLGGTDSETQGRDETSSGASTSAPTTGGTSECAAESMTEVLSTSETRATTGADATCPGPQTDACCCFAKDESGAYALDLCGAVFPCPTITLTCADEVEVEAECSSFVTACDEAIDCALDVLAKGEPAAIRWRASLSYWSSASSTLYVVGDGTAFVVSSGGTDAGSYTKSIDRRTVRPGSFFDDCAGKPSAFERFECIRDARIGDSLELCLPGFTWP
jgi:hypothetical protein